MEGVEGGTTPIILPQVDYFSVIVTMTNWQSSEYLEPP